jgi:asparagine synthase (glutamine-hydrolysing)
LVADSLGQQLLPLQVRFDDIRFDYGVPSSSIAPSIGLLQNTINQVWEAAGARYGASSFFSGGGGDSVFCYLKTTAPAVDAFIERGSKAGIAAIRDLSLLHQCTIWKAARLTFKKLFRKPSLDWSRDITLLNPECLALTPDRHSWMDAPAGALPGDREKIHDLIGTQLFRDMTPRGAGRAMHFPLLTQPVMEACLRVPSWMWIRDGRNRAVARDAFADLLPPGIIDRRSKGSYMSYMTAIYARDKWAMREFLGEGRLCANNLLDRPSLREFFKRELAPRDLSFLRIFDLCAAENWVRHQAQ